MGKTKIQWSDETWNPTTGCSKVSTGCKNCYAEKLWPRVYGKRPFTDVQFHADRLEKPMHWRKPRMVFVNSMSDLFHEDLGNSQIAEVFGVMEQTPQHTYQVLTKRPRRMLDWCRWVEENRMSHRPWPLPNVWLGVSVENQEAANERLIFLRDTPAAVRFVSYEPAIGPWDAIKTYAGNMNINALGFLDWVIVGGESGPKSRPCHVEWLRSIVRQCAGARVPCFMKQLGGNYADAANGIGGYRTRTDTVKIRNLKSTKGGDPSEWPEDLRVREFPTPGREG